MNKKEVIESIVEMNNDEVSKTDTTTVIDSLLELITDSLSEQEEVVFTGFGKFYTTIRAARKGRNPATGKAINIPEKIAIKFKPGKILKDNVN